MERMWPVLGPAAARSQKLPSAGVWCTQLPAATLHHSPQFITAADVCVPDSLSLGEVFILFEEESERGREQEKWWWKERGRQREREGRSKYEGIKRGIERKSKRKESERKERKNRQWINEKKWKRFAGKAAGSSAGFMIYAWIQSSRQWVLPQWLISFGSAPECRANLPLVIITELYTPVTN